MEMKSNTLTQWLNVFWTGRVGTVQDASKWVYRKVFIGLALDWSPNDYPMPKSQIAGRHAHPGLNKGRINLDAEGTGDDSDKSVANKSAPIHTGAWGTPHLSSSSLLALFKPESLPLCLVSAAPPGLNLPFLRLYISAYIFFNSRSWTSNRCSPTIACLRPIFEAYAT